MKRKTAKEILADSFRELAGTKAIDKITVKDITDNCGYSTATFYRQFTDKYDLIAWEYTSGVAEIMDRIGVDDYNWSRSLLDGALHFLEEKDYLINLFTHTSGHDSFIRYMTEVNCAELKRYILRTGKVDAIDEKTEMYIRLYCMGSVCLTCEWIMGKYKATPKELAEIYKNSLPAPLRQYLL